MDYKALLEKYWKGETSLAEEKALQAYFSEETVVDDLLPYKDLFVYYQKTKQTELVTSIPALINPSNKAKNQVGKVRFFTLWRRVAAAIILLFSISLIYSSINQPTKEERLAKYWAEKEIKDPVLAYQKTKIALKLVSKKLNGGKAAALEQISKVQSVGQAIKLDIDN